MRSLSASKMKHLLSVSSVSAPHGMAKYLYADAEEAACPQHRISDAAAAHVKHDFLNFAECLAPRVDDLITLERVCGHDFRARTAVIVQTRRSSDLAPSGCVPVRPPVLAVEAVPGMLSVLVLCTIECSPLRKLPGYCG